MELARLEAKRRILMRLTLYGFRWWRSTLSINNFSRAMELVWLEAKRRILMRLTL
jgi:hypothetical protein